jgi:hypothetical protein
MCRYELERYLAQKRNTRRRFYTLGEFKLWAKLRKVRFSTRAIQRLVEAGAMTRTGEPGLFEVTR